MFRRLLPIALGAAVLVVPPPAWAAGAPPNDKRADAIALDLPATLTGTLVGATNESAREDSACADSAGSVWYRFTAPSRGSVVVELDAAGEMDSTLDLYRRDRSKLDFIDCQDTDKGVATLDVDGLERGADYLIRVGRDEGSVEDTFRLRVLVPSPPPTPPGRRLPGKGTRDLVNRLTNPADAWNTRLQSGVATKVSLASQTCTSLAIYRPGVRSFDAEPVLRARCGGYRLFTPRQSGKYVFLVNAGRARGAQRYHLQVARAGRDDTAPGVFIGREGKVRGRVDGRIDSVDLYRFDVVRRSALRMKVSGDVSLELRRDGGRLIGRGESLEERVRPGRYYVAVTGSGRYSLTRSWRAITRTEVLFDGRTKLNVGPGRTTTLALRVHPDVTGRGVLTIERRDPRAGWQFLRTARVRVVGGSAQVSFSPPDIGRYRASGSFKGTRAAAASDSGYARLRVHEPLR